MRSFICHLAILLLMSCLSRNAICQTGKKKEKRPNFVIILADDLGYGDLGCYGQNIIRTPFIDSLSKAGIRFTDFYSGSPVSAPSRCSLLTGLHTGHAQIRDNAEIGKWEDYQGQKPLDPNTVSLPRALREAGYSTACIGKWGLGGPGSTGVPWKQGFGYFFGFLCQRQAHNHYPAYLWLNDEKFVTGNPDFSPHQKLTGDPSDPSAYLKYSGTSYDGDLFTDEALQYIKDHRDSSFFLMMTYTLPHLALQVPADYLDDYKDLMNDKPYTGQSGYLPVFHPHATYAAMVSFLDRATGKILAALKENGIDSNTCVIFTSDNGATFSMGGADPNFFTSNGGLRGGKGSLYEGGIRVPCIVSWPGKIKAGDTCHTPYAFWDIMPTLLQFAKLPAPAGIDGISFANLLSGSGKTREHEFLYWEFSSSGGSQAVRWGKWKAVRKDLTRDPSQRFELYDLSADVQEKFNVANKYPGIVQKMKEFARKRVASPVLEWNFVH